MRVYLPATFTQLRMLIQDGVMPVRSGTAFAATSALLESYAEGELEEIEYVAFEEAARASLRLLQAEDVSAAAAAETETPARRVVVSADIADTELEIRPDLDLAVVRLHNPQVSLDAVAAVHVDLEQSASLVAKACDVIDAADLGEEDAELLVGDVLDQDLAWFDPVELPFLLELG